MLRIFGKFHKSEESYYFFNIFLRSVVTAKQTEFVDKIENKKFALPIRKYQKKIFKENFVRDLFIGKFDKDFLCFPSALMLTSTKNNETNSVLQHCSEIEKFLNINKNTLINSKVLKIFNELELFGLSIHQNYGGLGYNATENKFIFETLGLTPKFATFLSAQSSFGVYIINRLGNEEQKQKYLPMLASGKKYVTLAYMEEDSVMDFNSIESVSSYIEKDKKFLLNASKKFVYDADISDLIIVVTRGVVVDGNEGGCLMQLFIIDKNTPGVTIKKMNYSCPLNNFFEVNLDNVIVSEDNLLQQKSESSYEVLKAALSQKDLDTSTLCLSTLKKIFKYVVAQCNQKVLNKKFLKDYAYINGSVGALATSIYTLESIIYLICGRFDEFEHPDLYLETCIAKVLAVKFLSVSIQKYIQILGTDSYKYDSILEEAFAILHYCSVFDENSDILKLITGATGIFHAVNSSKELRVQVDKLRRPLYYPSDTLFSFFISSDRKNKIKSTLNLKLELVKELESNGDILETCLIMLMVSVEKHLKYYGNLALNEENHVMVFGEMVAHIYALAASLSRASTAYMNFGTNSEYDINIVQLCAEETKIEIERLSENVISFTDGSELLKEVGKISFENKKYPIEHPLSRAF